MKSLLITTCGRCGTHWTKDVIGSTLNEFKINISIEQIDEDNVYIGHFNFEEIYKIKEKVNIVLLVRDFRDVCVSWTYFDIKNGKLKRENFAEGLEERLKQGAPSVHVIYSYLQYKEKMNVYVAKFEDIKKNEFVGFSNIFNHYNYSFSNENLNKFIKIFSFKELTGRNEGEEDIYSHNRKGIIGDWKFHLTEEQNKFFLEKHSIIMSEFGYY